MEPTAPKLIGITGRAGAGKNTLAEAIIGHAGGVIMSFADPLRDVVQAAFGSRYETHAEKDALDQFWNDPTRDHSSRTRTKWLREGERDQPPPKMLGDEPVTGRRILQFFGTEVFRELVHPDFWLLAFARRLEGVTAPIVAIPDVRFDNEARFIREQGGIVVHLNRLNMPAQSDSHVSERGVGLEWVYDIIDTASTQETRTAGVNIAIKFGPSRCVEHG
jgi:hypothetical protein